MRHLGMNQEQQRAHFHSLVSTFNVAELDETQSVLWLGLYITSRNFKMLVY